jgi:cytochrome c2
MIRIISFILFFIVFISFGAYTQEFKIPNESDIIESGKLLFEENCTVCHAIKEEVIGPALSGVHERRNID